jgi:FAD/FMN-containing dehydrogenase
VPILSETPIRQATYDPAHVEKCRKLVAALAAVRAQGSAIRLGKSTSNLFRHRDRSRSGKLNVRDFNQVLHVDPQLSIADVEGMATYATVVDATLKHGLLPTVVPQLKTITVGGAVSGIGIESSSFRYGLVHETVEEMEILLADGTILICSRAENSDLFFGFPNSYGTLGYVLRLKIRLIPAQPYVHIRHARFSDPEAYFALLKKIASGPSIDYLDGAVFGPNEMYVTTGEFVPSAARARDYTYMRMYYRSIRDREEDWLTAKDYIWRWDTDWFWCSKHFYVQNPVVRALATKWALNSRTYQSIMRLAHRLRPGSGGMESVIQDVDIPIENAAGFLRFLLREIRITPVWICPFRACDPAVAFPLYALDPSKLYVNFGFWDTVPTTHEDGYFNRRVESKMIELDGKKGLYSTAHFDRATFWSIYNKPAYDALKRKFDPGGVFLDLYAKSVESR